MDKDPLRAEFGHGTRRRRRRLYVAEEMGGESEFQFLEVIEINELVNAFVQLVSNLIAKGC